MQWADRTSGAGTSGGSSNEWKLKRSIRNEPDWRIFEGHFRQYLFGLSVHTLRKLLRHFREHHTSSEARVQIMRKQWNRRGRCELQAANFTSFLGTSNLHPGFRCGGWVFGGHACDGELIAMGQRDGRMFVDECEVVWRAGSSTVLSEDLPSRI